MTIRVIMTLLDRFLGPFDRARPRMPISSEQRGKTSETVKKYLSLSFFVGRACWPFERLEFYGVSIENAHFPCYTAWWMCLGYHDDHNRATIPSVPAALCIPRKYSLYAERNATRNVYLLTIDPTISLYEQVNHFSQGTTGYIEKYMVLLE